MPAFDKGVSIINTQLSIIPNFEQLQTNVDLNNVRQLQSSVQSWFTQRWATLKQSCEYDH